MTRVKVEIRQQPTGPPSHATYFPWDLGPGILISEPQFPHVECNNTDPTGLQGSCAFSDISAHECGTTLKCCKSPGKKKKKVRRCLLRIWFPYCLRHFASGEQPQRRRPSSRFRPQGPSSEEANLSCMRIARAWPPTSLGS